MHSRAAERHLEFGLVRQSDKIRIVLILFLTVVSVAADQRVVPHREIALLALGMAALAAAWSYFFLRWDELLVRRRLAMGVTLLSLFDICWLWMYLVATGGQQSPFWALLVLPVIFSATFFSRTAAAVPLTAFLVGSVLMLMAARDGPLDMQAIWFLSARLLFVLLVAWFAWGLASVLELERRANQRIVRYLTEGVLLINREGAILLCNPRMASLCGLEVDDIVGQRVFGLYDLPGYALLREMMRDVVKKPTAVTVCGTTLEGRELMDLRITTVPCGLSRGEALGWVVVVQDVTEIMGAARMKENTLGLLSHELRSPLASLRVMGQLLGGMAGQLDEDERERVAVTIEKETDRLSRLVTGLLDMTKIEQASYQLERRVISLPEATHRVLDLFEARAAESNLRLVVDVPSDLPGVLADPDRTMQILTNLLDNAVKYTPPGGEVRVSAQPNAYTVLLAVSDTGPGIAPEEQERVFEKFGQVHDPAPGHAERAGLGLGLHVARSLARKMGGDVYLTSRLSEGSTFTLVLARADTQPVSGAASAAA